MGILFSSLHHNIVVSQDAHGSLSWTGHYNGTPIKRVVPLEDGERCILLLDPDAMQRPVFENLLCIDRKGNPIWVAKLPASPDVFVGITSAPDGVLAQTWSGFSILLDHRTGAELKRGFVK